MKIRFQKEKKILPWVRLKPTKVSFFGAEIEKFFVRFLVQMKIAKSPFEINWPLSVQNEFKKALIALFTMKLIYCHTRQRLDDPPWAILRLTVRHEYHKVHKNKVILTGNRNILQGLTSFLRPTGGALEGSLIKRQLDPFLFHEIFEKGFTKINSICSVIRFYENLFSNFKSHTTPLQLIIIYLGVLISQISLFICYIRQKTVSS